MDDLKMNIKKKLNLERELLSVTPEDYYNAGQALSEGYFTLIKTMEALMPEYEQEIEKKVNKNKAIHTHTYNIYDLSEGESSFGRYKNLHNKFNIFVEQIAKEETNLVKIIGCCSEERNTGFREARFLAQEISRYGKTVEIIDSHTDLLEVVTPLGMFATKYDSVHTKVI